MKILNKIIALLSLILVVLLLAPNIKNASAAKEKTKDDYTIVVSLGDSYSSGESIEPFYGQEKAFNEKKEDEDWLAHRSKLSWPGQLKLSRNLNELSYYKVENPFGKFDYSDYAPRWYFVAVSGAESIHMEKNLVKGSKPQEKEVGIKYRFDEKKTLPYQLDVFKNIPKGEVDYVTMTLGGNDLDFVGVVKHCALSPNISKILGPSSIEYIIAKKINNELDKTLDNLEKVYKRIAELAGPQAQIIIAGYPRLFDPKGNGLIITKNEAKTVNFGVNTFNSALYLRINELASQGYNITFVDVAKKFDNRGAYSSNPYINEIILKARAQDLNKNNTFKMPGSAYSMHPNKDGAKAYADAVNTAIRDIEKNQSDIYDASFNEERFRSALEKYKRIAKELEKGDMQTALYYIPLPYTEVESDAAKGLFYGFYDIDKDGNDEMCIFYVNPKTHEAYILEIFANTSGECYSVVNLDLEGMDYQKHINVLEDGRILFYHTTKYVSTVDIYSYKSGELSLSDDGKTYDEFMYYDKVFLSKKWKIKDLKIDMKKISDFK